MKCTINTGNKVRFRDTENLQIDNLTSQRVNEFKYVNENSEIKSGNKNQEPQQEIDAHKHSSSR
jgi:hypothetical protein